MEVFQKREKKRYLIKYNSPGCCISLPTHRWCSLGLVINTQEPKQHVGFFLRNRWWSGLCFLVHLDLVCCSPVSCGGTCSLTLRLPAKPTDPSVAPKADVQEGDPAASNDCLEQLSEEPSMAAVSVALPSCSASGNICRASGWSSWSTKMLPVETPSSCLKFFSFGLWTGAVVKKYETFAGCLKKSCLNKSKRKSLKSIR